MFAPRQSPPSRRSAITPRSITIIIEMEMTEQNQTRLVVNEIFLSIQGESTYAGRPCAFVRLTGCNLRCNYCDTEYAFYEGRKMSVAEIITQLDRYRCGLIEITGGEPLLQDGVHQLIDSLLALDRTVMIETRASSR
jgi:7-carboxy-7-deazaguanine synthase